MQRKDLLQVLFCQTTPKLSWWHGRKTGSRNYYLAVPFFLLRRPITVLRVLGTGIQLLFPTTVWKRYYYSYSRQRNWSPERSSNFTKVTHLVGEAARWLNTSAGNSKNCKSVYMFGSISLSTGLRSCYSYQRLMTGKHILRNYQVILIPLQHKYSNLNFVTK